MALVKGKGDDGLPASEAQGTIATSLHALQSFGLVRVDRSFGAVRWKLTGIGASLSADVEFTL